MWQCAIITNPHPNLVNTYHTSSVAHPNYKYPHTPHGPSTGYAVAKVIVLCEHIAVWLKVNTWRKVLHGKCTYKVSILCAQQTVEQLVPIDRSHECGNLLILHKLIWDWCISKILHDLANKVAYRLGVSGKDLNTRYVTSPGGKRVSEMSLPDVRHKKAWLVNLMASDHTQNDTIH